MRLFSAAEFYGMHNRWANGAAFEYRPWIGRNSGGESTHARGMSASRR